MRGIPTRGIARIRVRTTICPSAVALLLMAGALSWAGCGGGAAAKAGEQAVAAESPVVATVTGTMTGPIQRLGPGYGYTDFTRFAGYAGQFQIQASDPRVSGKLVVSMEADVYSDESSVIRGSWVLTNDKGTWTCNQWTGAHDSARNQYAFIDALGTGEYKGLALHAQWHFTSDPQTLLPPAEGFTMSGWIQKAE